MNRLLSTMFAFIFASSIVAAQSKAKKEAPLTRILLIFDASNSMNAKYNEGTRIETAKNLFGHFVDSLQKLKNLELALRVYGHKKKFPPQDCNDTHLEVPFGKNNATAIKEKVKSLVPKGTTPIARSLMEAIEDFPDAPAINIVILITDGIEECDGDPCDAAKRLLENGIVLKPFVIGVGLNEKQAIKLECVGEFFDISSPESFSNIINIIIRKTLNETTAQVNILDNFDKATVTDVNMTFYNQKTKEAKYNFVHKMNALNVPDTLRLKPSPTYKLVINTIPKIEKENIKLEVGRHNIISVKAPVGSLHVKYTGAAPNTKAMEIPSCIIRKTGENTTLNIQKAGTIENYLEGTYNVEILTAPRVIKNDVVILPGSVHIIEIPQPGTLKLAMTRSGVGGIYQVDKQELKWVCNINTEERNQNFYLQPGLYKILYRERNSQKSKQAIETTVQLGSGEIKMVNLY